ncbi:MAG: tRNA-dihydrouridine synthase family protein [Planctomycetota bacterium]|nr:tRNA-dihydrouridine synthase family protein [Planctomycetota bacterium]
MGSESNNATGPTPAIAPGVELLDPANVAARWNNAAALTSLVPGFDAPFFQAGLAGYSDAPMRIIARRHGCPCCVTEALLDRTLLSGGRGFAKADLGDIAENVPGAEEDHPLVGQIMGSDPGEMAAAAVKMIEQGARTPRRYQDLARQPEAPPADAALVHAPDRTFAAIDVNLACPVKKIRSKARGGHWLREPQGAIDILRAVRAALPDSIPTSVKLRRGSDDSAEAERNFFRIFDAAYDLGYSWTTVHGRTVEQKYVGPSRWTFLRDLVRRNPDRIIFGSGDVWRVQDIFLMIGYTGVAAVSVARGCIGNPWIFRQARQMLAGAAPTPPTITEQRAVLREHFALAVALSGEDLAGRTMRKFGIRFAQHHPWPESVRRRFIACARTSEWEAVLDEFYDSLNAARFLLGPDPAGAQSEAPGEQWSCDPDPAAAPTP